MKRSVTILVAWAMMLLASGCGSSTKTPEGSTGGGGTSSPAGAGGEVFGEPGEKPSQGERPSGPGVEVADRDVAINPAKTKAKVGTTIIWTNHDSVEHNVTSVSGPAHFASKNIEEEQ